MKLTLSILLIIFCTAVNAQNFETKLDIFNNDFNNHELIDLELDNEYTAKFELVSIKPICPQGKPGLPTCMAIGSIITVKAVFKGCLDNLSYFDVNTFMYDEKLHIEIDAMALINPASATVRCIKMPEVIKSITVDYPANSEVVIENLNTLQ